MAGLVLAAFAVAGVLVWSLRSRSIPPLPSPPASSTYAAPSAPPLAPLDPATVAPDPTAPSAASSAPTTLDHAMHLAVITMYSRPASPDCALARTWLLAHGYVFQERDIDADRQAQAAWAKASPERLVPAFDIDGQAFGGFDAARIQGALEYAGARRLQR